MAGIKIPEGVRAQFAKLVPEKYKGQLLPPFAFLPKATARIYEHPAVWPTVYEQPVVEPHVSHFMHVPLRTSVKLPHSPHISPS
jgi:hypothetical protein